jgi:hypothetical protein
MECPVCSGTDLLMTERQGVEIDYCPGCRGVWLDRGELDKIIERANAESAASWATSSEGWAAIDPRGFFCRSVPRHEAAGPQAGGPLLLALPARPPTPR